MIRDNFSKINGLLSVILFGSAAREDSDEYSDVDIFLLVDNVSQERIDQITDKVKEKIGRPNIGISLYRKDIYNKLLLEGSMFLWHLKLEGKVIYIKEDLLLFEHLQPFANFNKNLSTYEKLYIKTIKSLDLNGINSFDLSQLFFICRNICLLTCFKLGHPTFGRLTAYSKLIELINVTPLDWSNYIYLSEWRLNYTRGNLKKTKYPTKEELFNLLNQIDTLMKICKRIIRGDDNYEKIR
ncbi:nucleotidyltransferase domain-containing protein (plasmid) [Priestia megaterium]|uniref:nucleotidyltransferase domain-containing protein n=1 Tax=Priestia megaterium TaxID=1404 RepID=UPI00206E9DCF|nr:nucleotidyltransferase domain-containing protein [Priestia megaterium]UOO43803.1 nucleotidyltransferase domain-containing protein [Priestia megaterium]